MTKKRVLVILGYVLGVAILLAAGAGTALWFSSKGRSHNHYPLLDSAVNDSEVEEDIINFNPLRQDIKKYLASLNIPHSFYFEYLPNGISIRDGEDQATVAASLIKTPLVMDLYRLAEAKRLDLKQQTVIEPSDVSQDIEYGDPSGLKAGQSISYEQAAYLALHNSDNTAINVVKRIIAPLISDDNEVILNLDIAYTASDSDPSNRVFEISARSYSSILKCLYYACFLNAEDSQKLLDNLTDSVGGDKLAAGLPSGVRIAHKIGSANNKQSDCGIVYQPKRPYLVCAMFFPDETIRIDTTPYFQKISKMISDYLTSK